MNDVIAAASARASRGGTRQPLTRSSTVSRQPRVCVVMIGRPIANTCAYVLDALCAVAVAAQLMQQRIQG